MPSQVPTLGEDRQVQRWAPGLQHPAGEHRLVGSQPQARGSVLPSLLGNLHGTLKNTGVHVLPEMPDYHLEKKVGNHLSRSQSWGWERKWEVTASRISWWHEDREL